MTEPIRLQGLHVAITGGARGIGGDRGAPVPRRRAGDAG
jgi:hypothetical protein